MKKQILSLMLVLCMLLTMLPTAAVFASDPITITYDANGGSGTMANGTATAGTAFTLPANSFTPPDGKCFQSWAIGSTSGTNVEAGKTYSFTVATSVYAVWKDAAVPIQDYNVSYKGGAYAKTGGSLPMPGRKSTGKSLTLEDVCFFRDGYTQTGWATSDGGAKAYELGGTYTADANVTLYPFWTVNSVEAKWGIAGTDGTAPTTWAGSGTLSAAMTYANDLSGDTAYIQLQSSVNTTAELMFSGSGKSTILDLSGQTIDGKNISNNPVIYVFANLTLIDTSSGGAGKITGGKGGYCGGVFVGGTNVGGTNVPGSFTMKGGIITGNDTSAQGSKSGGGGVLVSEGSFTMEGGSITGNAATIGGGVMVAFDGSFTMKGGSITGNTAHDGGGVMVSGGSFTMTGGSITKNISPDKIGGGVCVNSQGTITVGGTANISNNYISTDANAAVSNVYLDKDHDDGKQITITGSTTVPLSTGASIGVTMSTKPTSSAPVNITGTNSGNISGYFHSDDNSYSIQNSTGNVVQLAVAASTPVSGQVWNGTSAQYFAGGTGTEADPYQIATAEQLALLSAVINQYDYSVKDTPTPYKGSSNQRTDDRKVVENQEAQTFAYLIKAYYKLTADIVLNDTANWKSWTKDTTGLNQWKPIGLYSLYQHNEYFDGGNHTISGLYFSDATDSSWNGETGGNSVGLFGKNIGGEIKNVKLADSYIYGNSGVGGIAGTISSNITNCQNSGTITGTGRLVGGIAGVADGATADVKFENCQNSGTITGNYMVGGIFGNFETSTLTNCKNSGTVTATGEVTDYSMTGEYTVYGMSLVGGIAGESLGGNIVDCENTGAVTGTGSNVGGIAGLTDNENKISTCKNLGVVTGSYNFGGIAGKISANDTVTDCQNSGEIKRPSGDLVVGNISYTLSGMSGIGGIVGYSDPSFSSSIPDYSIKGCTNTGAINVTCSGTTTYNAVDVGGIVGFAFSWGPVINCTNSGAITVTNTSEFCIYNVGGIAGYNSVRRTVTDCQNSGAITANGLVCQIGGIVGENYYAIVKNSSSPKGLVPNATGDIGEYGKPTSTSFYLGHIVGRDYSDISYGGGTGNSSDGFVSPITSVSVSPATATVEKTMTQQFTATVTGTGADKSVTWSVEGASRSTIDSTGLLEVSGMETAATLTVKATSTVDSSKFGTATVTVAAAPKNCTVTFDSDGGSAVNPVSGIEAGNTITLPNVPTKTGYRFDGWYTAKNGGGTQFTSATTVTDSITVYAKWTKLVTVSGIVVEEKGDTPVSGATVTLSTYGVKAFITGTDGKFTFANIPEEILTVTATFADGSSTAVNVTGDYGNVKIVKPKPYVTITSQPKDAYIVKGIAGQSAVFTVAGKRTPNIADSIAYEWWWLKGNTPVGSSPDVRMTGSGSQMTINQDNGNIPDRGNYKLYSIAYDANNGAGEAYSRVATLKVVGVNTIEGTVKKENGDLVKGATVELRYVGEWPYGSVAMTTSTNPQTTGTDGKYKFELVPDGKYTLVITLPGGGVINDGPYNFPKIDPDTPINIVVPEKARIQVSSQPQDYTVKNGTTVSLSVYAASTDGTALTYQWYSNTKNSNIGGTKLDGATTKDYSPNTTNKGTAYYYCVVSGGNLTAETTRAAKITVYTYGTIAGTVETKEKQPIESAKVELINIDTPTQTSFTTSTNPQTTPADGKYRFENVPDGQYKLKITLPGGEIFDIQPINVPNVNPDIPVTPPDKPTISIASQPKNLTVAIHDTAKISVGAGVSSGEKVFYQWYQNTTNSTTGGTAINGAIGSSYSPSTATKGITYYYCVISANGAQAVTSNIAKLTVRNTSLDNLMTIEGDVVDESDTKVQGAEVTLSPKAGTSENPQTTASDGHYKFENLPDGKYTITVKLPGGGVIVKEIVIEDGEITPTPPNNISVPKDNSTTITQQPTDIEVTTEMDAAFTAKAIAAKADVSYQWYKNTTDASSGGTKLEGKNDGTLALGKQAEGVSYYYCMVSSTGAADVATDAAKLTVTKAGENRGDLEGGIVSDDDGNPVAGAAVKLMKNGTDGTQFGVTVTTNVYGKFAFTAVPYGSYSLVAEKDGQIITRQISIKAIKTMENLILPSGSKLTKVIIEGSNTPSVAIGNLEEMFTTADNTIAKQAGAQVEIKLVVQQMDAPENKAQIDSALAQNQMVGVYLNATLIKTVSGSVYDTTESIQPPYGQTLRIVLDIPTNLQGKSGYKVIRAHSENGVTDTKIIDPDYDSDLQTLSFDADAFSTYAVVYTQGEYTVTVIDSEAGASSGAGSYKEGDTVTIDAGTRSGYRFTGWTSTDGVTFANASNATTTFTMPAQNITVTANWKSKGSSGKKSNGSDSSNDNYTITATANEGGSISPSGSVSVGEGLNETFTITPNSGYVISDLIIDDKSVGAINSYTFDNVSENHSIKAEFKKAENVTPSTDGYFEDVNKNDWFYEAVMDAVEKGWFKGTSDTQFSPDLSTERGMIATVLWRMEGEPKSVNPSIFEDVPADSWFYAGVTWANENNEIVKGYGNGMFGPEDTITREQMAAILYRYAAFKGYDTSKRTSLDSFTDGNETSGYAVEAVQWAVANGLLSGKGDGILDPNGQATRAEVAAILVRFDKLFREK